MRPLARRAWLPLAAAALLMAVVAGVASLGALAAAAPPAADEYDFGNTAYDGRFVFVRIRYDMGFSGGFFRRDLPWAHDYPLAERNLSKILEAVTSLDPYLAPNGGNVMTFDDPEIYKFPFAYMSEPGYWTLNEAEARGLRAYLQKGGFLVFDDFRGDHWFNFERQLRRVLPDARLVELDVTHPIFHAFFGIETLEMHEMYGLPVRFFGVFEDNDPNRRLMMVVNYNNDIGEYWEFSDTGFYPVDLTNDSYEFGVNYVIYALTH